MRASKIVREPMSLYESRRALGGRVIQSINDFDSHYVISIINFQKFSRNI